MWQGQSDTKASTEWSQGCDIWGSNPSSWSVILFPKETVSGVSCALFANMVSFYTLLTFVIFPPVNSIEYTVFLNLFDVGLQLMQDLVVPTTALVSCFLYSLLLIPTISLNTSPFRALIPGGLSHSKMDTSNF